MTLPQDVACALLEAIDLTAPTRPGATILLPDQPSAGALAAWLYGNWYCRIDHPKTLAPVMPAPPGAQNAPGTHPATPGFWAASSSRWRLPRAGPVLRVYWNIDVPGAALLVRRLTEALDGRIEFSFKLPDHPRAFLRSDAAVLYLRPQDFRTAAPLVRQVHDTLAGHLGPEVPRLTRRLAAGLGLAESDLRTSESFGQSRCRLVAAGLLTGRHAGYRSRTELLAVVVRHLVDAGLDPARPHLEGHRVRRSLA